MKLFFNAWLIVVIGCVAVPNAHAQEFVKSQGGRAAAMGGSGTALRDAYAGLNNQAGLAFDTSYSVAVSATRRYWLSDMGENSLALAMPVGNGALGLNASYNGFADYNHLLAGLAYGLKITNKVGIGAQLDYLHRVITEYGSSSAVTFEVGVQAQVLSQLAIGAHAFNPVKTKSGYYTDQYYANELALGFAYTPSRNVTVTAEALNRNYESFGFKAGIEYYPAKSVALRAGVNNNEYTFGVGLQWKQLRFDLASAYHRYLGISPTGSLVYAFGKK